MKLFSLVLHSETKTINQYDVYKCWGGNSELVDIYIDGSESDIYSNCFDSCPNLATVKMSQRITSISQSAFSNCPVLTSVFAPNVISINDNAFSNCKLLQEISFPSLTRIGVAVFSNCKSFTSISFNNIDDLGSGTFEGCENLNKVTVQNLRSGSVAFSEEHNINLTIYSEIIEMDFPIQNIIEVHLPNATELRRTPFLSIARLKIFDAPKLKIIHINEFMFDKGLIEVNFPNVEVVEANAFSYCEKLEIASLPKVRVIESVIFRYCKSLKCVNIESVIEVKNSVFSYISLTTIIAPHLKTVGEEAFLYSSTNETLVFNELTQIGPNAFGGNTDLRTFIAPSLTAIPDNAFNGCSNLESIKVGTIVTLGDHAFATCEKLISIDISRINIIEQHAFYRCTSLKSVKADSVYEIKDYAFYECKSLKNFQYLKNCVKIGNYSFYDSGIDTKSITILGGGLIGDYAFHNTKFDSLTIIKDNTTIGSNVFANNERLTSVSLPSCSIAIYAFYRCNNIAMMNLTNAVGLSINIGSFGHLSVCIFYSGTNDCDNDLTKSIIQQMSYSVSVSENYQDSQFCYVYVTPGINQECIQSTPTVNVEPTCLTEYGNFVPYVVHFIISLV